MTGGRAATNTLREAEPECPVCGGDGWYIDHEDECYETGDCNCSGVQVECECQSRVLVPRGVIGCAGEIRHGIEMLRHWRGNTEAQGAWLAHIDRYSQRLSELLEARDA